MACRVGAPTLADYGERKIYLLGRHERIHQRIQNKERVTAKAVTP